MYVYINTKVCNKMLWIEVRKSVLENVGVKKYSNQIFFTTVRVNSYKREILKKYGQSNQFNDDVIP